jgi:hypothetical protein
MLFPASFLVYSALFAVKVLFAPLKFVQSFRDECVFDGMSGIRQPIWPYFCTHEATAFTFNQLRLLLATCAFGNPDALVMSVKEQL